MVKTMADVEKKIDILDETEETPRRIDWKIWVIVPVVLAAVAGAAFMIVRRIFGNSENLN